MKNINDVAMFKKTFAELMSAPLKYVIPPYQRAYMWSRKESQTLFKELLSSFNRSELTFLNNITLSSPTLDLDTNDRKIVDGQQRLLTLSLLLRATIDILKKRSFDENALKELEKSLYDLIDNVHDYRIKSQHSYANETLSKIFSGCFDEIDLKKTNYPANKFTDIYSLANILINRNIAEEDTYKFGIFLLNSVFFSVTITTTENEVSIFKSMNTTGLPLGKFDKLRIEFYEATPSGERVNFNILWSDFTARVWELGDSEETTIHHIGRGVLGQVVGGSNQVIDSLVERGINVGVIKFIENELIPSAIALKNGLKGLYPCGLKSVPLQNLTHLNRLSRYKAIRPIIIAAGRLSHEQSDSLINQLMKTLLVLSLSDSRPQYNEDKFKEWTDLVQKKNITEVISSMKKHTFEHSEMFRKNYPYLSLPYLGSEGVRFLLAIMEQEVLISMGTPSNLPMSEIFPNENFDIEHIAPKSFLREPTWQHLGYDFFPDMLPNLTILEKSRNRSVGNGPYSDKLIEYSKSKSFITSTISSSMAGNGKNNSSVKASKKLKQFSSWDKENIELRNQQFFDLLCSYLGLKNSVVSLAKGTLDYNEIKVIPQGRPDTSIKILNLVAKGMTSFDELKDSLSTDIQDNSSITDRNLAYSLESLEYFNLGYRVEKENTFLLSDTGKELVLDNGDIDKSLLYLCFTASLLKSGLSITTINKIKTNSSSKDKNEVKNAIQAIFSDFKEVTLDHRISALYSWSRFTGN